MNDHASDSVFSGSVAEFYERYLVPVLFEPYADDIAKRFQTLETGSLLEVAAGTGVATRALASGLSKGVEIVATDLNEPMIDHAQKIGTSREVSWRQADVMDLPFENESFDAVVCQFGVMFFPDKPVAFSEMHRVLRPGGSLVFNVWDQIESNEFANVVTDALAEVFPDDPPRFLARTPFGYYDHDLIVADLVTGGFSTEIQFNRVEARSLAETAEVPALALCHGTPLRNEIEARDSNGLTDATTRSTQALQHQFGATDLDAKMVATVITATSP